MSVGKLADQWRYEQGLSFKPNGMEEEEQSRVLDSEEFVAEAWSAYQSYGRGNHSKDAIAQAGTEILEQWRAQGREVALDAATAGSLAAAVSNHLSGFRSGDGAAGLFGRHPGATFEIENVERSEGSYIGKQLREWQDNR